MYCILPDTIIFERNKQYDRKHLTEFEPVTLILKWIIVICFMTATKVLRCSMLQILPNTMNTCYINLIKLQFKLKNIILKSIVFNFDNISIKKTEKK